MIDSDLIRQGYGTIICIHVYIQARTLTLTANRHTCTHIHICTYTYTHRSYNTAATCHVPNADTHCHNTHILAHAKQTRMYTHIYTHKCRFYGCAAACASCMLEQKRHASTHAHTHAQILRLCIGVRLVHVKTEKTCIDTCTHTYMRRFYDCAAACATCMLKRKRHASTHAHTHTCADSTTVQRHAPRAC